MGSIMVGVDGSAAAPAALAWAAGLTGPLDAELVVATVWVHRQAELPPELAHERRDELQRRLEDEWCAPARDAGVKYVTEVLDGDPPDVLLEAADRHDAQLLVVGASGAQGVGWQRLGSVAGYVAHRTARPLAVIPASTQPGIRRIILGLEGSPESDAPVALCAVLGARLGAEVVAVNACRPSLEFVRESNPASWHAELLSLLEGAWTAPLRNAGVTVRARIEENNHVAEALLDVANDEQADVIVVGARAVTGWRLIRLGGVTLHLLHHADRPVIIVPPPD